MNHAAARKAYTAVNAILAGVILLILGYSAFYSPDENAYPVVCIHEKLTGEQCPSCGMSHAFSLIVRGRFDEALVWNSYSIRIFLFFAVQLIMRITLGIRSLKNERYFRQITITDAIVSAIMTIVVFYPFLRMMWLEIFR